ncbi:MAG: type II toxin-antitoxin system Phd/YefM family antitoxin [Anaeromyxobacteraceae bacterium]|nr:type II toxin-antitoxin system Phd/YefM family antitoxin [Anaeromyxobacteraceae bacterium]
MRDLKVAEDIVPMAQFKAQAKKWMARLRETGQPLVITQNGRSAGVVLSPEEYDRLTYQQRFLASVTEGLDDLEAGRTVTTEELRGRLGLGRKGAR